MRVYLETERLILRRFTPDDVELATALDADPAVMRYINGGRPTPRDEIRDDYLPSWIAYYKDGDRMASGPRSRSRPARSSAGSTSARRRATRSTSPSSVTG